MTERSVSAGNAEEAGATERTCIVQVHFSAGVLQMTEPKIEVLFKTMSLRTRSTVSEAVRFIADCTNMQNVATHLLGLYDRNRGAWLESDMSIESYFPAVSAIIKGIELRERDVPIPLSVTPTKQLVSPSSERSSPSPSPPLLAVAAAAPPLSATAPTSAVPPQSQPTVTASQPIVTASQPIQQGALTQSGPSHSRHKSTTASLPLRLTKEFSARFRNRGAAKREETMRTALQPPPASYDTLDGLFWITCSPSTPLTATSQDDSSTPELAPIPAIFISYNDRDSPDAVAWFTVLYCLDSSEDLGMARRNWLGLMADVLKVNVFCFDFTGYGRHDGTPSEDAWCRDVAAVYLYLVTIRGIPGDRIVLCARGMGSGPLLSLAQLISPPVGGASGGASSSAAVPIKFPVRDVSWYKGLGMSGTTAGDSDGGSGGRTRDRSDKRLSLPLPIDLSKSYEVAGIVLINACIRGLGDEKATMFGSGLVFDNQKKAASIAFPVLIVHGSANRVVPLASAKKFASHFLKLHKCVDVPGASQENMLSFSDHFFDDIGHFLERVSRGHHSFHSHMRAAPVGFTSSPSLVVTKWLTQRGYGQYAEQLLAFGYYDLPSLKTITDPELADVGMSEEDQRRIFMTLVKHAQNLTDELTNPFMCLGRNDVAISDPIIWHILKLGGTKAEEFHMTMEHIARSEEGTTRRVLEAISEYEARLRISKEEKVPTASPSGEGIMGTRSTSDGAAPRRDSTCSGGDGDDDNGGGEGGTDALGRHHHRRTDSRKHHQRRRKSEDGPPVDGLQIDQLDKAQRISPPSPNGSSGDLVVREFVRRALPVGSSVEDVTSQVQLLFQGGIFTIEALKDAGNCPGWMDLASKLNPQLVASIVGLSRASPLSVLGSNPQRTSPVSPPEQPGSFHRSVSDVSRDQVRQNRQILALSSAAVPLSSGSRSSPSPPIGASSEPQLVVRAIGHRDPSPRIQEALDLEMSLESPSSSRRHAAITRQPAAFAPPTEEAAAKQ